jgi:hypothetical protein
MQNNCRLENLHKEILRDEVTQCITFNLGDESEDLESSDTEGEEDGSVSHWLFHCYGCVVLICQDTGNNYHSLENKKKARLHMFVLNFLLNYMFSVSILCICILTRLTHLSSVTAQLASGTLPFAAIGLSPRVFKYCLLQCVDSEPWPCSHPRLHFVLPLHGK